MKYTWAILVSTIIFTILGLIAAFGLAEYSPRGNRDFLFLAFALLPLGGAFAGLVIGCTAATLGFRYSERRTTEFEPFSREHDMHVRPRI
jgi:ABC-type spermidine/putrescine transport system permease subunit II